MAKLTKELSLYDRDEKGELIPQRRKLILSTEDRKDYPELVDMEIALIPIQRGVLKKMFGDVLVKKEDTDETSDDDSKLVQEYCKDPVFTEEELQFAKPVITRSVIRTILHESGVKFDDKAGTKKIDQNDEFGKNSLGLDEKNEKDV